MKRLLILLFLGLFLLPVIGGCNGLRSNKSGVEVVIEGDGEFPEFLVGTWKADKSGWEFSFEPDGQISSAVISLGRVRIKPGVVTTVPMREGGKGVFEPGRWTVHYVPVERELTVEVSLKHFYVELGDDLLKGKSTDIFVGTVSEDGTAWPADWFTFPEYIADTDKHQNFKVPFDPNDNPQGTLFFRKVTKSE